MISPKVSNTISLESCLDDVEARFLYNLPESELAQVERLFFQIEQAWWFYEDFMADKHKHLPHFKSLKSFADKIFQHCPLLAKMQHSCEDLFNDFGAYKNQIPVFGCILLSPDMKKVALACNWSGTSWGFPRGKINEGESPIQCAIRETFEETGFDATLHCKKEDSLVVMTDEKVSNLFIATNVPEETVFEPQTRKEISKVEFHDINNLPKRCYGIHPFIPKLKHWISKRVVSSRLRGSKVFTTPTRHERKRSTSAVTPDSLKRQPKDSAAFDARNADTFSKDIAEGAKGWDVSAMFAANAKLTGRAFAYDGNPHAFGASHPRFNDYRQQSAIKAKPGALELDLATIAANTLRANGLPPQGPDLQTGRPHVAGHNRLILPTSPPVAGAAEVSALLQLVKQSASTTTNSRSSSCAAAGSDTTSADAKQTTTKAVKAKPPLPTTATAATTGGGRAVSAGKAVTLRAVKVAMNTGSLAPPSAAAHRSRSTPKSRSTSTENLQGVQQDQQRRGFSGSFSLNLADVMSAVDAILQNSEILTAGELL